MVFHLHIKSRDGSREVSWGVQTSRRGWVGVQAPALRDVKTYACCKNETIRCCLDFQGFTRL